MSTTLHDGSAIFQDSADRHTRNGSARRCFRARGLHLDQRGLVTCTATGKSWQIPSEQSVRVWSGATRWLASVTSHFTAHPEARRGYSLAMILLVAATDAASAEAATGRGVTTSHDTVARSIGRRTGASRAPSRETVRHCRRIIEHAGYARTVTVGCHLTTEQRATAHQHHGGRQIAVASERVLVQPRAARSNLAQHATTTPRACVQSKTFNPLVPSRREVDSLTSVPTHQARVTARRAASRSSNKTHPRDEAPRHGIAVQRLAAELVAAWPHLNRTSGQRRTPSAANLATEAHQHIGAVCEALTRAGIDPADWTAQDIIRGIDRRNHETGRTSLHPALQDSPIAVLHRQLTDLAAHTPQTPAAQRRAAQAAQARRAARRAAEQAEARELARTIAHDRATGATTTQYSAAKAIAHQARLAALDARRAHGRQPIILDPGSRAAQHR